MDTASIEVTKDLPTPPFPLTTAITFFISLDSCGCTSRLSGCNSLSEQSELQVPQLLLQFSVIFVLLY
jgi:hypothetical protein